MAKSNITVLKNWMNTMGFELVNSHDFKEPYLRINYYTLGNFGIYEEISVNKNKSKKLRFITWNPWGIDFEVFSLKELQDAYHDFIFYSPEIYSKTIQSNTSK